MLKKVAFFLLLLSAVGLLFLRFSHEHSSRHFQLAITYDSLLEFYKRDVPKRSEQRFKEYLKECSKQGISMVFQLPMTASPLLLSGQIQVLKSDQVSTVLRLPHHSIRLLDWAIPVVHLKSNAKSMEILIDLPLQEIMRKEIFGYAIDVAPMQEIPLRERYIRKGIDGILVDKELIVYDLPGRVLLQETATRESLFEPRADLQSEKTILNQYKRAFWERKKEILIIPFFQQLAEKPDWEGLPELAARINKFINPLPLTPSEGFPPAFHILLRMLLLVSIMLLIFPKWWYAFVLSLPYILFPASHSVVNAYLILFTVILPLLLMKILIPTMNNMRKYYFTLVGILFAVGAAISGIAFLPSYISTEVVPVGIRFSVILSFLLVAIHLQWKYLRLDFSRFVHWKQLLLLSFVLLVLVFFLVRSGNNPMFFSPGSLELQIRDFLDAWLPFRPRFKEFLFAFPILLLIPFGVRSVHKGSKVPIGMLLFGSLGFISVINTFWHFHSFLLVSYARTFSGLLLAIPIAMVLWWGILLFFQGKNGKKRISFFRAIWSRFVSGKGKRPRFPK